MITENKGGIQILWCFSYSPGSIITIGANKVIISTISIMSSARRLHASVHLFNTLSSASLHLSHNFFISSDLFLDLDHRNILQQFTIAQLSSYLLSSVSRLPWLAVVGTTPTPSPFCPQTIPAHSLGLQRDSVAALSPLHQRPLSTCWSLKTTSEI